MIEKALYLPKEMDDHLRRMAKDQGINTNTLIVTILSQYIGEKCLSDEVERLRLELESRFV